MIRLVFLTILLVYILNTNLVASDTRALPWILSVGAVYALMLMVLWVASTLRPQSDGIFASVLLLDLAALSLALPYDPTPACPAMFSLILVVLDNGFRREARYYLSALLCAALVGAGVIAMRGMLYGAEIAQTTLWLYLFVMFTCVYCYFLFRSMLRLRRKLAAAFELADASEDFIFALNLRTLHLNNRNNAVRKIADRRATLSDVFQIKPAQATNFVNEACKQGQATREWALRDSDRFIEVKAKLLDNGEYLACTGRDMSLHHARAGRLRAQSRADPLTGIPNRRALDRWLSVEWQNMLRVRKPLAVLMIDIDWFKNYNDAMGHPAGDRCLQEIAALLRDNMQRTDDFVARFGGEEFTVILPDCDIDGAQIVAQRLINSVAAENLPHAGSPFEHVTISVGAAAMLPTPEVEAETLIQTADAALYNAKRFGRNRVCAESGTASVGGAPVGFAQNQPA